MDASEDWREAMRLAADPYSTSNDRWMGTLPAGVDWARLEDRLIARGWYAKNAISWLRVYGCEGGHEIVIEPASRQVVFRVAETIPLEERSAAADELARTLAQEARIRGSAHAA